MISESPDRLPDINCGSLRIWAVGRQFPNASDCWDGNWLNVVARCDETGASISIAGPFLHLGEILQWEAELRKMYEVLGGTAELATVEPNLGLKMSCDHLGNICAKCEITPDHLAQRHSFSIRHIFPH